MTNEQFNSYFYDLKKELEKLPHGTKGEYIKKVADSLGISKKNVYEHLKKIGYSNKRKTRSDKGKTSVSEELAYQVAGYSHLADRQNKKKIMPIKLASEILAENGKGVINQETGEVKMPSPTTLARVMKQYGCHPSQLKSASPAVSMRSLHPNHVWQLDASVCVLYYLPSGELQAMEKGVFYKNKPHNAKKVEDVTVLRYVVVDHYSGAFYVHYDTGHENAEDGLWALIETMSYRSDTDPLCGVPKILITDKGSGNTSAMFKAFCENIGIELIYHEVGNPRAKGQVEQCQNLVETNFEGRLRYKAISSREELQELSDTWRKNFCARVKHTRHNKERFTMWNTISPENLIVPSSKELLKEIVSFKQKPIKVNEKMRASLSTNRYGRHFYDLTQIPDILIGEFLDVKISPYKIIDNAPCAEFARTLPNGDKLYFLLEPQKINEAGFIENAPVFGESFKSKPKTKSEKALDAIEKMAYNANTLEEIKEKKKKKEKPFQNINPMADMQTPVHYFKNQSTDLITKEAQAKINLPKLTCTEVAFTLKEKCPKWQDDPFNNLEKLKASYPNGIERDSVPYIISSFNNNEDFRVAKLIKTKENTETKESENAENTA